MQKITQIPSSQRSRRIMLILFVALGALLGQALTAVAAPAASQRTAPQTAVLPAATCTQTGPNSRTCDLWATTGSLTLPDGNTVTIYGYADTPTGTAQMPGPLLIVNEGETVTVNLTNTLPEDTALYFAGQAIAPDFVGAAASGGTTSYSFVADAPGTFRYEAGLLPNAQHQVAMGMFGALIVRPNNDFATLTGTNDAADGANYPATVLADAPAHYWRLGESSTAVPALDETGNSDGTYGTGVTLPATGLIANNANTAAGFDGTDVNGYVHTNVTSLNPAAFTVEAWANANSIGNTGRRIVVKDEVGITGAWLLWFNQGKLRFQVRNAANTAWVFAEAPVTPATGSTFHAVGVFDGTDVILYLDGVEVARTPLGSSSANVNALQITIGADSDTDGFKAHLFDGTIDEVAVYETALSATQIQAHTDAATAVLGNTLTDNSAPFTGRDDLLGGTLTNDSDGSSCIIAAVTPTTLTCAAPLSGGTDNSWEVGDGYTAVSTGTFAYPDLTTAYDDEAIVILSEIDPALNNSPNPATFDMRDYKPTYWLINGQAYPDTAPIPTQAGHRLLIRYVNAGLQYHAMSVMGLDQLRLAEDGIPYAYTRRVVGQTLTAGQTMDVLIDIPASTPDGAKLPLYEGNLLLHNNNDTGLGGMMTFITTPPGGPVSDVTGPATTAVSVSPSPTSGTIDVTLTATMSDMGTGDANIVQAEYYINDSTGTAIPMDAVDAAFDSPVEDVTATILASTVIGLGPGDHTLYVRGQDANGNWGPFNLATLRVEVTGSGPTTKGITLVHNPSSGGTNVLLSATADDSATGNNLINAGEYFIGAPGTDGSGTPMTVNIASSIASLDATLTPAILGGLTEGVHTVYVHGQDSLGLWGTMETIDLHIDKTGPNVPTVTISPSPNNGALPINQSLASIRVDATLNDPLVAGVRTHLYRAEFFIDSTGPAGSGIPMYARDGVFDTTNEEAYALISLVNVASLAPGPHTIYVRGRDASGNWGPFGTATLTIEAAVPTVTGTAVSPNPTGGASLVTLTAVANDAGSNITQAEWFVGADPGTGNGTPMSITPNGGSWDLAATIDVTGWAAGTHSLSVRARDAAGSWSTTDSVVLTIDTAAPTFGVTVSPATANQSGAPTATVAYQLTVANTGNTDDTYDVVLTGNGWTTTAAATVGPVTAGGSAQLTVEVAIPGTAVGGDTDIVTVTVTSQGDPGQTAVATLTTTATEDLLYFSTAGIFAVPGIAGPYDDADIYSWNGSTFSRLFDGSAAGLPGNADIDGLHVIDADTVYMSFKANGGVNVPTVGVVDDEDIVLYDAGVWSLYFDGNEVGLGDNNGEDVDAFTIMTDGSILLSTVGNVEPDPNLAAIQQDEDILRCEPTGPAPITGCTWSVFFDGTDVGLTTNGEDVGGIALDNGEIFLTTLGGFSVAGLSGNDEDVFICSTPTLGENAACTTFSMYFDGTTAGMTNQIDAIDLPTVNTTPPALVFGVGVTPTSDAAATNPGATVTYELTVANTGNTADAVDIALSGNAWPSTAATTVGPIPAGGSTQLMVEVTIPGTAVGGDSDTVTVTLTSQGDPGQTAVSTLTTSVTSNQLYFSTASLFAVPGTGGTPDDADIYSWDGAVFARIFDASAAGLPSNADIDGLHMVDNDTFYVSFNRNAGTNVPGVGVVDDEDIVFYDAGVWSLYFDGNEVGLGDSLTEDVDAFEILDNGHILISALGAFNPDPDFPQNQQDEDLIECAPTGAAPITACTWSIYLDGSDIGLGDNGNENVSGVSVANGTLYLSMLGPFNASGISGAGYDIMACTAPTVGPTSACTSASLYFEGFGFGLTDSIDAFDLP